MEKHTPQVHSINWVKSTCDFSKAEQEKCVSDYECISKCVNKSSFTWRKHVRLIQSLGELLFNTYSWVGRCGMQFFVNSKSPLAIATGRLHTMSINSEETLHATTKTTSSFVLCALDIKENESISSEESPEGEDWETCSQ